MKSQRIQDLCTALDRGEIVPYFQPIVDIKTMQVCGFEVLARWEDPAAGATLPVGLIRLAEGADLIWRITEALISRTADLARTLPEHLKFSINISPGQFCDASFAETLHAHMDNAGLNPSQVMVEITETALLENFDLALTISKQLKSYGTQLALDDFGTGYSSLRHLQALPFDELKIDGSFVNSMSERRESRKIVAAIVGLSHSLGITTVAEGIETKAQAEMLYYLGCARGQGWLFSHPLPPTAVADYFFKEKGLEPMLPSPQSHVAATIGTTLEVQPAQRLSQLQAIYDGAAVGLCFLDRDLRYVSLNKPLAEAKGLSIENHLGRTVAEVMPENYPKIAPYLQRALQGVATNGLEVTMAGESGSKEKKTYLVSYEPARDEAGEVVGVSVVLVDITMRKRAENTLRASIDHYWRAAGSNPQVPWTADSQGNILDISPRWDVVTGLTRHDALDGRWKDVVHAEDRERVVRWFEQAVIGGTPLDLLCRLCRPDGEAIWIRMTAAARFGSDGKVERWYGTMEEINTGSPTEYAYYA
ncbi:MAG: EAL domain-containing protein [Granulicella sp.]